MGVLVRRLTMKYHIKMIHKISPRDTDVMDVELPDSAFADCKTLAKVLRTNKVLGSGVRVRHFCVEGDKIIVFPSSGAWHSLILKISID